MDLLAYSLLLLVSPLFLPKANASGIPVPITSCDLNKRLPIPPRVVCSESCTPVLDTSKRRYIYLYNSTEVGSVNIADCRKFKISQVFTKTWTFSEIPGIKTRTPVKPTVSECNDAWAKQCNKGVCGTTEPEITPEYHWASNTEKEIEYISIDAFQETIVFQYGGYEANILVHGNQVSVDDEAYVSEDQKTLTLWTPVSVRQQCPWTKGNLLECIVKYSDGISLYCPTQGLTLDNVSPIEEERCPGVKLYVSSHHIVFRDKTPSDQNDTLSQYMQLPAEASVREWIMMDSINEALQTRDYLECMRSCMSFDYTSSRLQIFGVSMLLLNPELGQAVNCNLLPNCRVILPIVTCVDPPQILVNCSGTVTWWNATGDYTIRPTFCHSMNSTPVDSVELQTFNGPLIVNATGIYPGKPLINPNFIVGHLVNPNSLLATQDPTVVKIAQDKVGLNPVVTSNITTPHPGIKEEIVSIWESINRYLTHEVKVLIISGFCLLLGTLILIISIKRFKYGKPLWAKKKRIRLLKNKGAPTNPGDTTVEMEYILEDD